MLWLLFHLFQNVLLQLSDDPLEVKLGDNYQVCPVTHLSSHLPVLSPPLWEGLFILP